MPAAAITSHTGSSIDAGLASSAAAKEVIAAINYVFSGEVTLGGTNPTTVATGLSTITSASVSLKTSTAPGDDPSWLSYTATNGTLNIYAWKNTGGTDPTLVASTNNTAVIGWMATGTV